MKGFCYVRALKEAQDIFGLDLILMNLKSMEEMTVRQTRMKMNMKRKMGKMEH